MGEALGFAQGFSAFEQKSAGEAMYNLTGKATSLSAVDNGGKVKPVYSGRAYMLNDFVVTHRSQAYGAHPRFKPLRIDLSPAEASLGANHSTVANQFIADKIIEFIDGLHPYMR